MNILYIGPYRQIDYIGQCSLLHIRSILKSMSVSDRLITRPLYLDTSLSNQDDIYDTEKNIFHNIDILVQYLPVNFVAIQKNIKNIVIPIIDPKIYNISQDNEYKILNYCDKIAVEEDKIKNLFKHCGIKTSIETYNLSISHDVYEELNLNYIEGSYRVGFLGQYQTNKQILHKIIHSFLIASRQNHNLRLYLFLRGSDNDKEEIERILSTLKEQLNIPSYIQKIYTIFGMWGEKESIAALNSIDCFLSINDDYRYYMYEKYFVESKSTNTNFLINRNNVQTIEIPLTSLNYSCEYKNTVCSISTQDLIYKLTNPQTHNKNKTKKIDSKSLGDIVCK